MVECLPEMDVPFPGFETQGWELVLQAPVFLTIGSNTADLLVHAYNRMRSANDQLDRLRDLVLGDSALRVALANASTVRYSGDSEPGIDKVIGEYLEHRAKVRDGLLGRLEDLKEHLDNAIDAVEAEIEIGAPVSAAGPEVPTCKTAGAPR
jgi:hypothetical protein